jgi:hypothetical protein
LEVVVSVNRISLVVTSQQRQSALDGLGQVRAALPGLGKLRPGERRELHGFGAKNEVFARGILRALQANPQVVPTSLDVAGAQADLDALDILRPLLEAVDLLQAELEDTVALLGHDAMDFAYDGYQLLKVSGGSDNSLDDMRRGLGSQFRRTRQAATPEPVPAA